MMRYLLEKALRGYQILFAPWLGGHCRFHPTCSEYFKLVLNRYPWWKACLLTAKRLLKCHPAHPGGVDFP